MKYWVKTRVDLFFSVPSCLLGALPSGAGVLPFLWGSAVQAVHAHFRWDSGLGTGTRLLPEEFLGGLRPTRA